MPCITVIVISVQQVDELELYPFIYHGRGTMEEEVTVDWGPERSVVGADERNGSRKVAGAGVGADEGVGAGVV